MLKTISRDREFRYLLVEFTTAYNRMINNKVLQELRSPPTIPKLYDIQEHRGKNPYKNSILKVLVDEREHRSQLGCCRSRIISAINGR